MSEKRFGTKIDDVDSSIIVITDKCNDFAWFLSDVITDKQVEKVVALLNALDRDCNNLRIEKLQFENKCTTLEGENEQLKNYFKKRAECSNFQINKLKEEIAELQEDNVDTIVELSKENEQLRQTIQKIAEIDGLTVDELLSSIEDVSDEKIVEYLKIFESDEI